MRLTQFRIPPRFVHSILCITALAALPPGCGGGNSEPRGRLTGVVYDGAPNSASRVAAGVKVIVLRYEFEPVGAKLTKFAETTSDRDGRFTFNLPPDYYGVYAENGYNFSGIDSTATSCTSYVSEDVLADQTSNVELGYEPCDPNTSGAVN